MSNTPVSLKTATEFKIVEFLTTKATRPMIVSEIAIAIGANRENCANTLKRLVSLQIIRAEKIGKSLFYAVVRKTPEFSSPTPEIATPKYAVVRKTPEFSSPTAEIATSARELTAALQELTASIREIPTSMSEIPTSTSEIPPSTSKVPTLPPSKTRRKLMSPAKEVALLEGAAGSAVGNDTPPAAPAALLPPETPETPQKIDYADFVAQTTQEPPDCHYTLHG